MIDKKIGIIGCGNMGEALISHISRKASRRLVVSDIDVRKARKAGARYNVSVADGNIALAKKSDVIILAVKPKDIAVVLGEIRQHLTRGKLIISIAAGIKTGCIEKLAPRKTAVIRVMPNMPAVIGEAISSLTRGRFAGEADLKCAKSIFSAIGEVVEVDERLLDAVTAVSGSGPAYLFYLVESLLEAAREMRIPDKVAKRLVFKTMLGSSKLLEAMREEPHILRARVTSKGGTTEAAFRVFHAEDFMGIVKKAVKEAFRHSKKLSKG